MKDIRDFRITDAHLQEFGYTRGCLGCDAQRHGIPKGMRTNACHARIEFDIKAKKPEAPEMMRRDERHSIGLKRFTKQSAKQQMRGPFRGVTSPSIVQMPPRRLCNNHKGSQKTWTMTTPISTMKPQALRKNAAQALRRKWMQR